MERRTQTLGDMIIEFMAVYVVVVQQLLISLAISAGTRVVLVIVWAVRVFVLVVEAHYLFGTAGSFIALFVESGSQWWWFFWEFLEMGVKFVLFNLFLLGVIVATARAKSDQH